MTAGGRGPILGEGHGRRRRAACRGRLRRAGCNHRPLNPRPEPQIGPRYAIFAKPPSDGALWAFGSAVIGYDAESGAVVRKPAGLPLTVAAWEASVREPGRYGFHGTLKAPFHLAERESEHALVEAAGDFARGLASFAIPSMEVAALGGFLALVPSATLPALDRLAGDTVRVFDRFRAPTSEEDQARRLATPLTARQVAALDRWGYPYVFDDFRFHMTLTGRVAEAQLVPVRRALAELHGRIAAEPAFTVASIAIFRQPTRTERFRVLAELPFGG